MNESIINLLYLAIGFALGLIARDIKEALFE